MAEPQWTGYVGVATGIVGAIAGIAGMVLGYLGYKTSNSLKSLDLRLELRKSVSRIQSTLLQLSELIEYANQSRKAVASATGRFHSGMMTQWKQLVEKDKEAVSQLSKSAPAEGDNFDNLAPMELETKLVEVHRLQLQADELKEKYEVEVRADNEARNRLRDDARARLKPKN